MTSPLSRALKPSGSRRGVWASAASLLILAVLCVSQPPPAAAAPLPSSRPLVTLLHSHVARVRPDAHARRIETVAPRRPLTRIRTVLPVLGQAARGAWLRVRLPGRPNGHTGWIAAARTRSSATEWSIEVKLSSRRVTAFRRGREVRRFRAVVGKPSTPTPRGRFFVEEALALSRSAPGGPFALATSARSNVLQEFEGGPGQIALHGRNHLSGALGTASSHGCVRLGTTAIVWLSRRIGAGTPVAIVR
jgi:lipoprotein-anchoring transpeptidase ErfK/SrfK